MKISSASQKVLASALSAAMVVAFAPTVAFGATPTKVATNTYFSATTGAPASVEYYDADLAFNAAMRPQNVTVTNGSTVSSAGYMADKAAVALNEDATLKSVITDDATATGLTVDLGGYTLTSKVASSGAHAAFTVIGTGTIKQTKEGSGTQAAFSKVNVGTSDDAAEVTFNGGTYNEVNVASGSSVKLANGTFILSSGASATTVEALSTAVDEAKAAGATVTITSDGNVSNKVTEVKAGYHIQVQKVVATAGDDKYPTIAEAITANSAGATEITLQDDLDLASANLIVDSAATINLNGHTLTRGTVAVDNGKTLTIKGEGKLVGVTVGSAGTIEIAEGAKVSVETSAKDTKKTGYESEQKSVFSAGILKVKGELTIADNGATTAGTALVVDNRGVLTIGKGKFTTATINAGGKLVSEKANFTNVQVLNGGSVEFAGGEITQLFASDGSYATVNGGKFDQGIAVDSTGKANLVVKKAILSSGKLDKKFIAEGSVQNDRIDTRYEVGAPVAIAQSTAVAEDGTKYTTDVECASLDGAIKNASSETTIKLTADVEETVAVNKVLTIDLNGKTVKGQITVNAGSTTENKAVVIKNGNVVAYGQGATGVAVSADMYAVIESGTFTAEEKLDTDGKTKLKPSAITAATGTLKIKGGTFKDAVYPVAASEITGGTFDKKPTAVATKYVATQNEDKTWTVALGDTAKSNFVSVNGYASTDNTSFKVADVDKALEKAVDAAYSKALTAAWSANPKATELAGFEFAKKSATETYVVEDLTKLGSVTFALVAVKPDAKDVTIKADKDYTLDGDVYTIKVAINGALRGAGAPVTVGYLTGIAIDVAYTVGADIAQDTASNTYGFVGGTNVKYDAKEKTYTFSTTTGAQFAPEKISNSILELQEQMKQMEIAAQDKAAANSIKGTAKTIKTKKGVTGKKYTVKLKAVTSESGAKATYKKANTAGKSKITVSKAGTITVKKGLKKGTYKVKVKGTVGASSKTVTAKIVIK